jgi:tetratricopeptide (TPR) repeat protein
MSEPTFLMVQVGHRSSSSIKANLGALSRQTHKNWKLVYVNDGNDDHTTSEFKRYTQMYGLKDRLIFISNEKEEGLAQCLWKALKMRKSETHAILMKGKHRFSQDRALEKIAQAHSKGWAVVWGKWRDQLGNISESGALHPYEELRQQPWIFGGPLSFELKYLSNLTESDLKTTETETFFNEAGMQAFGYGICEATIKRRFLREVLFTYDEKEPSPYDESGTWHDEWMSIELQEEVHDLASRETKELRVDQVFFKDHIYEFTEMAFLGERYLSRRELNLASMLISARGGGDGKMKRVGDIQTTSSIASTLLEQEDLSNLTEDEEREVFLRMDIEDAEMMAEAGFHDEALKIFAELMEYDPENARIHTNIGVLHWNMEETQEGMKHFLLAIRYDRDTRDPVMNCAGAWVELGRLDQAKMLCVDFLSRYPDDHPISDLLTELESIEIKEG